MAWTAWHDFVGGETLTATLLDQIVNNIKALFPVGMYGYIARAATTAETLVDGIWLECNGVSVLRATYPDLNTYLSGLGYPFGTADGTHFTLPPAEGRALVSMSSGGHSDVNALGDNDGVAKANRSPKHNSTNGLSISGISLTGAPGKGTLAAPDHTHLDRGETFSLTPGSTPYALNGNSSNPGPTGGASSTALTGAPDAGTLAVSGGSLTGSVGPGGTLPVDTPAYLVAGTLFIKAFS